MKKNNIAYIHVEESCSKDANVIRKMVTEMLDNNKLPYIIKEKDIFYFHFQDKIYKIKSLNEVIKLAKSCIVIEASYSNESKYIIDTFLNNGVDILSFPSRIFNPFSSFSNNLIRDGAICITSIYMLLEYLQNFI